MKTYKMFNEILFILSVSTVCLLIISTIYEKIYGVKTDGYATSKPLKTIEYGDSIQELTTEINPQPFKTGYVKNAPQQVADVCNSVMYPVYIDPSPIYSTDLNDIPNNNIINIFNSPP